MGEGIDAELTSNGSPGSISADEYQELVGRIRERVRSVVPPTATVLVVSKGDQELTEFEGRQGWHFPRQPDGKYAGFHPADSDDAIERVEELRREGAEYFVLPSTQYWWFDHYAGFRRHLTDNCRQLSRDADCMIFHLSEGQAPRADTELMAIEPGRDRTWEHATIARLVQGLLPAGAVVAALGAGTSSGAPSGCRLWRLDPAVATDEDSATDALRELAAGETEFLVIPSAAFGWLEQNPAFGRELRSEHRFITRQSQVCEIFELCGEPTAQSDHNGATQTEPSPKRGVIARLIKALRRDGG
jgi:hypothetical protein